MIEILQFLTIYLFFFKIINNMYSVSENYHSPGIEDCRNDSRIVNDFVDICENWLLSQLEYHRYNSKEKYKIMKLYESWMSNKLNQRCFWNEKKQNFIVQTNKYKEPHLYIELDKYCYLNISSFSSGREGGNKLIIYWQNRHGKEFQNELTINKN